MRTIFERSRGVFEVDSNNYLYNVLGKKLFFHINFVLEKFSVHEEDHFFKEYNIFEAEKERIEKEASNLQRIADEIFAILRQNTKLELKCLLEKINLENEEYKDPRILFGLLALYFQECFTFTESRFFFY